MCSVPEHPTVISGGRAALNSRTGSIGWKGAAQERGLDADPKPAGDSPAKVIYNFFFCVSSFFIAKHIPQYIHTSVDLIEQYDGIS